MLNDHPFKLTKFVNGYFSQDDAKFRAFLQSRIWNHWNCIRVALHNFSNTFKFITRRGNGLISKIQRINALRLVLRRISNTTLRSLAIFLKQKQSHFPEIIHVIDLSNIHIQHLEIHQFFPTEIKKDLPLPVNDLNIETLVFPPPGPPKEAGDLCAYVELRTPIGRRKFAQKLMMQTLPKLTRLVLVRVVHENDYEFRRNLPIILVP